MSTLKAYLTNCILDSLKINLHLDGKSMEIVQYKESNKFLTNIRNETSYIIIHDVDKSEIDVIKNLVEKLVHLLKFMTHKEVTFYAYAYPENKMQKLWATIGTSNWSRSLIPLHKKSVEDFIHQVWNKFNDEYAGRKLDYIFEYLVQTTKSAIYEHKIVLCFLILESLKYTYALEQQIPYKNGRFRTNNNKPYSFSKLLNKMFNDKAMIIPNKDLTNFRNELIHSGILFKSDAQKFQMLNNCIKIIREYLIKLIGYTGFYYQV